MRWYGSHGKCFGVRHTGVLIALVSLTGCLTSEVKENVSEPVPSSVKLG